MIHFRSKWLLNVSIGLSTLLLAVSLAKNSNLFQNLWNPNGLRSFFYFSALFWLSALLLPRVLKNGFTYFALTLLIAAAIGNSGVGPCFATALILLSSYSLGRLVFQTLATGYATPLGLALWAGVFGLLAHYRVNYAIVHLGLLLIPVLLRFKSTYVEAGTHFRAAANGFNLKDFPPQAPLNQFLYSLLTFCLLILSLYVQRPDIGFDALSYHFYSMTQLFFHHRASFDVTQHTMAVLPAASEWLFSVAYILGGEPASHLLNLSFVAIAVFLIVGFFNKRNETTWGLLVAAAFLSTPMVNLETSTLFVENLQLLFIFAGTLAAIDFEKNGSRAELLCLVILFASSLAVKANSLFFLAAIFPFTLRSLVKHWRNSPEIKTATVGVGVALLFVFGFFPYLFAYLKTGNPVFPFMNAIFKSPYFPSDQSFNNPLFNTPFTWHTPYDITFHTSKFLESSDGSFGFHFFFFVPILLGSVPSLRTFEKSALTCATFLYFILVFKFQSYLRYIYPALPGFFLLSGLVLSELTQARQKTRVYAQAIVIALIALSIYLRPGASFWFRDFDPQLSYNPSAQKAQLATFAPERLVIQYLNLKYGPAYSLLQLRMPYVAEGEGSIYSLTWYHQVVSEAFDGASSLSELRAVVERLHITHLARRFDSETAPPLSEHERLLREFFSRYSKVEEKISYLEIRKFDSPEPLNNGT